MPVVSALNLILAAHPNRSAGGGVMVGRNKFFHPSAAEPPVSLGGGLEAWRGFYSSVRPAHKTLMVNVNICTTAFYTAGNLAEQMQLFVTASFGARANAFAKNVRVQTTHLGYRKTVKGVSKFTARQHKFDAEGMGMVTVEEYFKRSKPSYTSRLTMIIDISCWQNTTFSSGIQTFPWWTSEARRRISSPRRSARSSQTSPSAGSSSTNIPLR